MNDMRKWKVSLLLLLVALMSAITLEAAPLYNVPQIIEQPDGTKIACFASGDEYLNYLHDAEGNIIVQDEATGYYTYAVNQNDRLVPSNRIVGEKDHIYGNMNSNLDEPIVNEADFKENEALIKKNQLQQQTYEVINGPYEANELEGVVIFVRFKEDAEFVDKQNQFDSLFMNPNGISLYNYFDEVSYHQLALRSTFYPYDGNGEYYSYVDEQPREYYMPYSATNPLGYDKSSNNERYKREMALYERVCAYIERQIEDTKVLDRDQDGLVDSVTVIIAGTPNGWNSILWPHVLKANVGFARIQDKEVNRVVVQLADTLKQDGEKISGVGALAHESFHILGAPDLYHYTASQNAPVGVWDLMGSTNNYYPQSMLSYMKYKYGGWMSEPKVIENSGTYVLNPIGDDAGGMYKICSSKDDQISYILEYRKKEGLYESHLPSEGLLVYRVNEHIKDGNKNGPPDEVYIFRPISGKSHYLNEAPLKTGNRWESVSGELLSLEDGTPAEFEINNVYEKQGQLYFDVLFDKDKVETIYQGIIDLPVDQSEVTGVFLINGWYANNDEIVAIEVSVNGNYLGIADRYERPGLQEALPGLNAQLGGYAFAINANNFCDGDYTFEVTAVGRDGSKDMKSVHVSICNHKESEINFKGAIDLPISGSTVRDYFVLSGWMAATEPLQKVEVYVNGAYLGEAVRYFRPGLQEVLPHYVVGDGGIAFGINTYNFVDGNYEFEVKAIGESGKSQTFVVPVCIENERVASSMLPLEEEQENLEQEEAIMPETAKEVEVEEAEKQEENSVDDLKNEEGASAEKLADQIEEESEMTVGDTAETSEKVVEEVSEEVEESKSKKEDDKQVIIEKLD